MTTATRERRLILKDWEVRAILQGRKTRTTRLVKLRKFQPDDTPGYDWTFRGRRQSWNSYREKDLIDLVCPYGKPGTRLWCAEPYLPFRNTGLCSLNEASYVCFRDGSQQYLDDGQYFHWTKPVDATSWPKGSRWRSPATMPRWASRIILKTTSVRIQRVCEITEKEAIAEGFESTAILTEDGGDYTGLYAHEHFQTQWALDYGMDAVEENQFVWVIEHWRIDA